MQTSFCSSYLSRDGRRTNSFANLAYDVVASALRKSGPIQCRFVCLRSQAARMTFSPPNSRMQDDRLLWHVRSECGIGFRRRARVVVQRINSIR